MTQIPLPASALSENHDADAERDDGIREIANDVAYCQLAIVNVVLYGRPGAGDGQWVRIDAGVFGSGPAIRHARLMRYHPSL